MGLTRQERQDRLWNKAVELRDKAGKERVFNALLEACRHALKTFPKEYVDMRIELVNAIKQAEGTIK